MGKESKAKFRADLLSRLQACLMYPENHICADCPERNPTMVSLLMPADKSKEKKESRKKKDKNKVIGVFCCKKCINEHMLLGRQVCEVKNVKLVEQWTEEAVSAMEFSGNRVVNCIYESKLDPNEKDAFYKYTDSQTQQDARSAFIAKKYRNLDYFDSKMYRNYWRSRKNPRIYGTVMAFTEMATLTDDERTSNHHPTPIQRSLSDPNVSSLLSKHISHTDKSQSPSTTTSVGYPKVFVTSDDLGYGDAAPDSALTQELVLRSVRPRNRGSLGGIAGNTINSRNRASIGCDTTTTTTTSSRGSMGHNSRVGRDRASIACASRGSIGHNASRASITCGMTRPKSANTLMDLKDPDRHKPLHSRRENAHFSLLPNYQQTKQRGSPESQAKKILNKTPKLERPKSAGTLLELGILQSRSAHSTTQNARFTSTKTSRRRLAESSHRERSSIRLAVSSVSARLSTSRQADSGEIFRHQWTGSIGASASTLGSDDRSDKNLVDAIQMPVESQNNNSQSRTISRQQRSRSTGRLELENNDGASRPRYRRQRSRSTGRLLERDDNDDATPTRSTTQRSRSTGRPVEQEDNDDGKSRRQPTRSGSDSALNVAKILGASSDRKTTPRSRRANAADAQVQRGENRSPAPTRSQRKEGREDGDSFSICRHSSRSSRSASENRNCKRLLDDREKEDGTDENVANTTKLASKLSKLKKCGSRTSSLSSVGASSADSNQVRNKTKKAGSRHSPTTIKSLSVSNGDSPANTKPQAAQDLNAKAIDRKKYTALAQICLDADCSSTKPSAELLRRGRSPKKSGSRRGEEGCAKDCGDANDDPQKSRRSCRSLSRLSLDDDLDKTPRSNPRRSNRSLSRRGPDDDQDTRKPNRTPRSSSRSTLERGNSGGTRRSQHPSQSANSEIDGGCLTGKTDAQLVSPLA